MRDPLGWSFPLGRLFGINIRVHWMFPLVGAGLVLREAFKSNAVPGSWIDAAIVELLLLFSVLWHEFGHCFAARAVDGEANEILLWPLGGLAGVEVPQTPRANLITALGGPAVNLLVFLGCGLALAFLSEHSFRPPLNPISAPYRTADPAFASASAPANMALTTWSGDPWQPNVPMPAWVLLVAKLFWVNWVLFLLNVVLIGFPLDGGRIFQCILWPYVGFRQATLTAIFAGFVTTFIVVLFAIIMDDLLALCLAVFIYVSCKQQLIFLETGGEESMFGYDFSQGYTSLEREQPVRRKQSWWQRWQQRRTARRVQREQVERLAEERRMDELLQKVQSQGINALTDEERRFLKRVSDRYKRH